MPGSTWLRALSSQVSKESIGTTSQVEAHRAAFKAQPGKGLQHGTLNQPIHLVGKPQCLVATAAPAACTSSQPCCRCFREGKPLAVSHPPGKLLAKMHPACCYLPLAL